MHPAPRQSQSTALESDTLDARGPFLRVPSAVMAMLELRAAGLHAFTPLRAALLSATPTQVNDAIRQGTVAGQGTCSESSTPSAEESIRLTTVVRLVGPAAIPCTLPMPCALKGGARTPPYVNASDELTAARLWVQRLLHCACALLGLPCPHDARTAAKVRNTTDAPRSQAAVSAACCCLVTFANRTNACLGLIVAYR